MYKMSFQNLNKHFYLNPQQPYFWSIPIKHIKRETLSEYSRSYPDKNNYPIFNMLFSLFDNKNFKHLYEHGGRIDSWAEIKGGKFTCNRALIRDDGKILSDISTRLIEPSTTYTATVIDGCLRGITHSGNYYNELS